VIAPTIEEQEYVEQGYQQPVYQQPVYQQPVYQQPLGGMPMGTGGSIGFSPRINDPAFAKFIKNSNRYALIFAGILFVIAVVGFTIYGQTSDEMGNPQAFFIGLGVGTMFVVIAIFQVLGKKGSKTWDGQVVDKTALKKIRRQNSGDDDVIETKVTEFTVVIRGDNGKTHKVKVDNNNTFYNYVQIGDKLRFHGGLNTYEKYDKSHDDMVFCNACGKKYDMSAENCKWCKCPLLK
jgi:hypothetical protein